MTRLQGFIRWWWRGQGCGVLGFWGKGVGAVTWEGEYGLEVSWDEETWEGVSWEEDEVSWEDVLDDERRRRKLWLDNIVHRAHAGVGEVHDDAEID